MKTDFTFYRRCALPACARLHGLRRQGCRRGCRSDMDPMRTDNPELFLDNGFDYVLCGEAENLLIDFCRAVLGDAEVLYGMDWCEGISSEGFFTAHRSSAGNPGWSQLAFLHAICSTLDPTVRHGRARTVISRQTWLRAADVHFTATGVRSQFPATASNCALLRLWPKRWPCSNEPALNISGSVMILRPESSLG